MVALAAGGTGGHLFPAQALAEELHARGIRCLMFCDERALRYADRFPPNTELIETPSSTITPGRPWKLPGQGLRILKGILAAHARMKAEGAGCAVGFGGYPSLPPLLAARLLNIPLMTHDAGAVVGFANRLLAKFSAAMAVSFPRMANMRPEWQAKAVHTGNPVRRQVLQAAQEAGYAPPAEEEPVRLLVVGGSQGAHFFAEMVPDMVEALPESLRARLALTMQCREEDMAATRARLERAGLKELALRSFFTDLPRYMARAHLVIARAGASTLAELMVLGRPAVLIPYPHLADGEQIINARAFEQAGAGRMVAQEEATGARMAALLTELLGAPEWLMAAHEAALAMARPDAAQRMADMVEDLLNRKLPERKTDEKKQGGV